MQKSSKYIWCVYTNALLLHPLSGTKAAILWHSDRKRCRNPFNFPFPPFDSDQIRALEKKKEKKLPKTFGRYKIKFLPLHPLLKRKAARVDILIKKRWQGLFSLLSFSFLSIRETTRRKKRRKIKIKKKLPKTFGSNIKNSLSLHPLSEKKSNRKKKRSLKNLHKQYK